MIYAFMHNNSLQVYFSQQEARQAAAKAGIHHVFPLGLLSI